MFALLLRVAQELVETGDAVNDGAVELHERNPARHAQAIERGNADAEPGRGLRRPQPDRLAGVAGTVLEESL